MASQQAQEPAQRHGKLSIPLPFEDALRAALRVKPEPKPEKPKKHQKAAPRPTRRHGTTPEPFR